MRSSFFNISNGLKRVLSGSVLILLVLYVLIFSSFATVIFIGLLACGLSHEWLRMGGINTLKEKVVFYGILILAFIFFEKKGLKISLAFLLGSMVFSYYGLRFGGLLSRLKTKKQKTTKKKRAFEIQKLPRAAWFLWGGIYIGAPCLSFLWIYNLQSGRFLVLWILFIIWASDTGAYIVGPWLKGPKLAPRISPQKTWSGFGGGFLFALMVGIGSSFIFKFDLFLSFFGIVLIFLCSVLGDLLESFLKRLQSVKDSGALIPGHGGVLDRADSALIVFPVVAFILWIVQKDFLKEFILSS